LTALDGTASLFAHCASFALNALYEPANRYNQDRISAHGVRSRLDQADVVARALGLDMVRAGWKPRVDNYLGRVTKPRILEAVREAKGEASAQLTDHPKKGDMAKEAERLLDGSGWLPDTEATSTRRSGCRRSSRVRDRCQNSSLMKRSGRSRPTKIGHNLMPPNSVMSQDGSDRPAFEAVRGGRRAALVSIFVGEGQRGRAGPGRA
jgi:hypothetical protein